MTDDVFRSPDNINRFLKELSDHPEKADVFSTSGSELTGPGAKHVNLVNTPFYNFLLVTNGYGPSSGEPYQSYPSITSKLLPQLVAHGARIDASCLKTTDILIAEREREISLQRKGSHFSKDDEAIIERQLHDLQETKSWLGSYLKQHPISASHHHPHGKLPFVETGLGLAAFAVPFGVRAAKRITREGRAEEEIKENGKDGAIIANVCMTPEGRDLCKKLGKKSVERMDKDPLSVDTTKYHINTIGELRGALDGNPALLIEFFSTAITAEPPVKVASITDVVDAMIALGCPLEALGLSERIPARMNVKRTKQILLTSSKNIIEKHLSPDLRADWAIREAMEN